MVELIPGLNAGQSKASEEFFQFLFSDEPEIMISGGGGVGKSHLVSHLIDKVIPQYEETCEMMGIKSEYQSCKQTALTNKAAEVLAEATKRFVGTIYSFMNLKVAEDYSTGVSKAVKTTNWHVHEQLILFVDECSMTDVPLDNFMKEGLHKCKIVWVGDHCQMYPVIGTNPLYKPGRMRVLHLTEDMRTTIPEIRALKAQLRETVETGVFKPIKIVPGIIDHLDDDQMQLMLSQTFAKQTTDSRILAYTNKRVIAYNDYIRHLRGLPEEYTVGELLVNNSAIRLKGSMLSVESQVEITKLGDEYDIPITSEVNLRVRNAELMSYSGGIYKDVPLPVDRTHFNALIAYFKRDKNWAKYYELKNTYPDLRQFDAATVYKSQGSTYDSCFIDLGDISTCKNSDQVARMLYVALSRERYRIFLFGELAEKYGGLIH